MLHLLNRIFSYILVVPFIRTLIFGHPVMVRRRINKHTKPNYDQTKCFHKFENGYNVLYYVHNKEAPNRWHKYDRVKMEIDGSKWVEYDRRGQTLDITA